MPPVELARVCMLNCGVSSLATTLIVMVFLWSTESGREGLGTTEIAMPVLNWLALDDFVNTRYIGQW